MPFNFKLSSQITLFWLKIKFQSLHSENSSLNFKFKVCWDSQFVSWISPSTQNRLKTRQEQARIKYTSLCGDLTIYNQHSTGRSQTIMLFLKLIWLCREFGESWNSSFKQKHWVALAAGATTHQTTTEWWGSKHHPLPSRAWSDSLGNISLQTMLFKRFWNLALNSGKCWFF